MANDIWGGLLLPGLLALGVWRWAGLPLPAGLMALVWPDEDDREGDSSR